MGRCPQTGSHEGGRCRARGRACAAAWSRRAWGDPSTYGASDFNVPALHQFTYILLQVNDRHLKTACHISNDKIKPASTVSHLPTVLKARCHCPHSSGAVRSPAGGSEPAALMACSDTAVTQKGHSAWSLDEPRPWSSLNPCLREAGHWHDLVQGEIRNQDH